MKNNYSFLMLIPRNTWKSEVIVIHQQIAFSVLLKQIVIQTLTIQTEFQPSEGGYIYDCVLKT